MLDADLLFNFNPLAPDYLNGLVDVGTPAGFEDVYCEETWLSPLPNDLLTGADRGTFLAQRKYFTNDFMIYGLKAVYLLSPAGLPTPFNPAVTWNVRLIDVDGVPMCNTRLKGSMVFGIGQFPKPCVAPIYVPAGKFLGIDFQYENNQNVPAQVQLIFLGLRRRKVRA